jgi:Cu2+-exporting ATPase
VGITLNPMIGAAAMGFSSVCVVTNALRLRGWQPTLTASPAVGDDSSVIGTYREENEMETIKLSVEGMMCQHCVAHVTKALEGVEGIANVHVDLDDKSATFGVAGNVDAVANAAIGAVKEAGYETSRI